MNRIVQPVDSPILRGNAFRRLRKNFTGRLILPGDREYESARRVHNGAIERHPAVIAMCCRIDDVGRGLEFANENQLLIAVRSGGHSQAGYSVCDAGIVRDLSGLKQAEVDPGRRVARVQTGTLAGDLDQLVQEFGLVTPIGQCPSVGLEVLPRAEASDGWPASTV
jgi:FAD/FMN-containing dehydrogenase